MQKRAPICLFGVVMHPWTMEETVQEIRRRMDDGGFTQHVVVNVAKIVNLQSNEELRAAISSCDIVNIDGAGVVLAGRLLGYRIPERVAGVDLFYNLLEYCQSEGESVYFLGAKPDVIDLCVKEIAARYPELKIAGFHHGYFWDREESVVKDIQKSRAGMLFVGISSPMKERFIDNWSEQLGVRFAMGVGGTLDIAAGITKRAPLWMQRYGMEWVYRIIQEPRRMFMRYLKTNTIFAGMLFVELVRKLTGSMYR